MEEDDTFFRYSGSNFPIIIAAFVVCYVDSKLNDVFRSINTEVQGGILISVGDKIGNPQ